MHLQVAMLIQLTSESVDSWLFSPHEKYRQNHSEYTHAVITPFSAALHGRNAMRPLATDVAWSSCLCLLDRNVTCDKTQAQIEMPFGLCILVGTRNHAICGTRIITVDGVICWEGTPSYYKVKHMLQATGTL